jgi:hypothetical protein
MPKKLEKKLKKEAGEKGLSGKEASAYVYGTMRKTGWTPGEGKGSPPTQSQKHGSTADIRKLYS